MSFSEGMFIVQYIGYVFLTSGTLVFVSNIFTGTANGEKYAKLGLVIAVIGMVSLIGHRVAPTILGKEQVRVENVSESMGSNYVRVVVPKEDEDKIKSKEFSIVELKTYYNDEYDKDGYIDKSESIELYLDTTSNYTITDYDTIK